MERGRWKDQMLISFLKERNLNLRLQLKREGDPPAQEISPIYSPHLLLL